MRFWKASVIFIFFVIALVNMVKESASIYQSLAFVLSAIILFISRKSVWLFPRLSEEVKEIASKKTIKDTKEFLRENTVKNLNKNYGIGEDVWW